VFRHLYIHIPYCVKKCPYCDFFSVEDDHRMGEFLDGLAREFALVAQQFGPLAEVETVFVGGGTPTYLPPKDVHHLGRLIRGHAALAPNCEWTLEANPESTTGDQIARFVGIGVNRVSVGVQSFDTGELMRLGRAHSGYHARAAAETLTRADLRSWSMDFLFGVAGQSMATWKENVAEALDFHPPHLSAYALTIEPGSRHARDPIPERFCAEEELVVEQYRWLRETLVRAGYEHYEVSNYAKPGHRCRHNEAYWTRRPYLGLGPSAHSFDGRQRWWNVRNIDAYLDRLNGGERPVAGCEVLDAEQIRHEVVMLSLRRSEGLRWSALPQDRQRRLREGLPSLVKPGLVEVDDVGVRLTDEGWPLADAVISRVAALVSG